MVFPLTSSGCALDVDGELLFDRLGAFGDRALLRCANDLVFRDALPIRGAAHAVCAFGVEEHEAWKALSARDRHLGSGNGSLCGKAERSPERARQQGAQTRAYFVPSGIFSGAE
jgi:hypothetical protein